MCIRDRASDEKKGDLSEAAEQNSEMLGKIQSYLRTRKNYSAKSAEIVDQMGLKLTERLDILKLRALLKQIAKFQASESCWVLKSEFRE